MTRSLAELRQYLAGEWLFDNDFQDTSGNGNDGTPTNIEWKPTVRGMKPLCTGAINCGNDDSIKTLGDTVTFCFVVKPFDLFSDVLTKYAGGTPGQRSFSVSINNDGKIVFGISNNGEASGLITTTSSTSIFDGYFHRIICVYNGTDMRIYLDGILDNTPKAQTGNIFPSTDDLNFHSGKVYGVNPIYINTSKIYTTDLSSDEVLVVDSELQKYYGIMPAEHSFTHNPDDVINASDAVGAWGTAKESTTKLVDLSSNGNIADIHGAMPAEGFIQGRRFGGVVDYLDCGNGILNFESSTQDFSIFSLVKINTSGSYIAEKRDADNDGWNLRIVNDTIWMQLNTKDVKGSENIVDSKLHLVGCVIDRDGNGQIYIDGETDGVPVDVSGETMNITSNLFCGVGALFSSPVYLDGCIFLVRIHDSIKLPEKMKQYFNTFARLPFWSVNYTDYPDNVTEYTTNLPYSSSIISSGTFKVDDDKLQCVSAGTITYSASYEFDGSEYIKVVIDGVEYAGTGTITHGNTTVSVAQGSNKITIAMGTADTIDKVRIQFREEV